GRTRLAPAALQASPARVTAAGSPEMTVWSGALRLAGTATSLLLDAPSQAAATSAVLSPMMAAIAPARGFPASSINSPRRRTMRAPSVGVRDPAATYALY